MTEPPPEPAAGGFLARLIERASGRDGDVAPRLPSQYESPTLQPAWAAESLAGTALDGEDIEAFEVLAPLPTRPAGTDAPHSQRIQEPTLVTGGTAVPAERRPSINRPKTVGRGKGARSADPAAVRARTADLGEATTPLPMAAVGARAADPDAAATPPPMAAVRARTADPGEATTPLPMAAVGARAADPDAPATPPPTAAVPGVSVAPRLPPRTTHPTIAHPAERRRSVDPALRGAVPAASTAPAVRPVEADHPRLSQPSARAPVPSHPLRPADPPPSEAAGAHRSANEAQRPAVRWRAIDRLRAERQRRRRSPVVVEAATTRVLSTDVPIGPPPDAPPPRAVVNISIGRVEVRAVPAASPPRAGRRDSRRPSPTLSLEEYLTRREVAR